MMSIDEAGVESQMGIDSNVSVFLTADVPIDSRDFWGLNITLGNEDVSIDSEQSMTGALKITRMILPIAKAICICLLFMTSIAANLLVFAVFYHKPVLLTTSNKLLIHLAFTQCFMLLLIVPLWTASIFEVRWYVLPHVCTSMGIAVNTLLAVATFTLVLVSLDRFYAITKPLHYARTITSRRIFICLILIWMISIAISLPPLIGWGQISYHPEQNLCITDWIAPGPANQTYSLFVICIGFVIPLIIQLTVYAVIYWTARKATSRANRRSINIENGGHLPVLPSRRRSNGSVTQLICRRRSSFGCRSVSSLLRDDLMAAKTAVMALSCYLVCWLPYYLVNSIDMLYSPDILPEWAHFLGLYLVMISCLVNPVVYIFRSKVVKETLCVKGYISLIISLCPGCSDKKECSDMQRSFAPLLRNGGRLSIGASVLSRSGSQDDEKSEVRSIITTCNATRISHMVV